MQDVGERGSYGWGEFRELVEEAGNVKGGGAGGRGGNKGRAMFGKSLGDGGRAGYRGQWKRCLFPACMHNLSCVGTCRVSYSDVINLISIARD